MPPPVRAGGTAGAAGVGGSGGVGGTLSATRKCGDGEPCSVGASCAYSGIESGVRCECDASRHFLCDAWSSAGAPPFEACNENTREPGAGGGSGEPFSCSHTNGYCTRTCSEGSCTVTCEGSGPAEPEPGMECAASYCDQDYWGWGGCEMADGDSCDYQLDCGGPGVVTSIEGSCE